MIEIKSKLSDEELKELIFFLEAQELSDALTWDEFIEDFNFPLLED